MKTFRKNIFLPLIILSFSVQIFGQINIDFTSFTSYSGNIFHSTSSVDDYIISPQLSLSYTSEKSYYYYTGYLTNLLENSQYNRRFNKFGYEYFHKFSENFIGYFGSNFSFRKNEELLNYYDYSQLKGYTSFKYYPTEKMLVGFGGSLQNKNFSNEEAWNHTESMIWIQNSLSLPTRTSLRFSGSFLYRNFQPYSIVDESIYSQSGRGKWMAQSMNYEELSSLWQTLLSARVAQSITTKIGGYTDFSYRYNPSDGNPYELEIQSFSPIDDYFGYGGLNWTTSLKYKFNQNLWSKFDFNLYNKKYTNRPVYLYDFTDNIWVVDVNDEYIISDSNRKDTGYSLEFSTQYKFEKLFNKPSNLILEFNATYFNNDSNDPYFKYDDISIGFQLGFDFQK